MIIAAISWVILGIDEYQVFVKMLFSDKNFDEIWCELIR